MTVREILDLTFSTPLIRKPEISDMIRRHDVMVDVRTGSIQKGEGHTELHVIGNQDEVDRAVQFLRDAGAGVKVRSREPYDGDLPEIPPPPAPPAGAPVVERKVWLTFTEELVERPALWEMARRFGVEFDIRQSSVSREVGIIGVLLRGPEERLEAAREFLESIGVEVEPIEKSVVEG